MSVRSELIGIGQRVLISMRDRLRTVKHKIWPIQPDGSGLQYSARDQASSATSAVSASWCSVWLTDGLVAQISQFLVFRQRLMQQTRKSDNAARPWRDAQRIQRAPLETFRYLVS